MSFLLATPVSAETKGYVVSWFTMAMNSQDGDCPGGVNLPWSEHKVEILRQLGYSQASIDAMLRDELAGKRTEMQKIITTRGRVDGKPVNPYTYPATVADPKLHAVQAKFAYGFDLDGRKDDARGFEDPETHETGVDNELSRALGCMREFRGSLTTPPLYWDWTWGQLKDNQPAWLVTITGEDLGRDGDVTVTFDRALEHLRSNVDGSPREHTTYRVDPDPRSHNVYAARLRDGIITLRNPGASGIRLLQDPLVAMEFRMSKVQMRIRMNDDQTISVLVGGYQPWADLYYSFAGGGSGNESASTGDIPGIYHLFRKYADADPDPVTGRNASISATYYLRAIPAFVAPASPERRAQENHRPWR